ncbi:MAG: Gfo/Idh/MocA family protein [Planctomycetota bacterium]
MNERVLKVAVIGGGMFFDDIIGQSLKDFQRGGIAGALTSIGMSHLAPEVAGIGVKFVAIGTHSAKAGTAGKIAADFEKEFPGQAPKAHYGETVWREILDEHKPDVLIVATPDHLHTQPILEALECGVHVLTEKPMCLKTDEADRMIALAAAKKLVLAVDLHKRYDPFVREMMTHSLKKYDRINRIRAVLEEPLEVSTEVFKWAEHSNPFAYVGCHWLDVVAHYTGVFPAALFATGQKNLLIHWDEYVKEVARRQGRALREFSKHAPIKTWDAVDVTVTYDNGMRGDYNNNWINPREFEGAVNQEIEVYGVLGRGFVDQQYRGFRETIIGDGTRTRNPTFGGRIQNAGGKVEIFGYGKASLVAGLLAIERVKFLGADPSALANTYPDAVSQRSIVMIIEAAGAVAEKNFGYWQQGKGTPVSARFERDAIVIVDPFGTPVETALYRRASGG